MRHLLKSHVFHKVRIRKHRETIREIVIRFRLQPKIYRAMISLLETTRRSDSAKERNLAISQFISLETDLDDTDEEIHDIIISSCAFQQERSLWEWYELPMFSDMWQQPILTNQLVFELKLHQGAFIGTFVKYFREKYHLSTNLGVINEFTKELTRLVGNKYFLSCDEFFDLEEFDDLSLEDQEEFAQRGYECAEEPDQAYVPYFSYESVANAIQYQDKPKIPVDFM